MHSSLTFSQGHDELVMLRFFADQIDRRYSREQARRDAHEPNERSLLSHGDTKGKILCCSSLVSPQFIAV
jgi:hypothetical protein